MSVPNEAAVQAMLERLRAYQWPKHGKGTHHASTLLLAREYYRRMLLWGRALNCQLTGHQWAFFSVIREIGLGYEVDKKVYDEISDMRKISWLTRYTFLCILAWAAMNDSSEVKQFQLPNPYDPLLFMYDRGSQFYRGIGDAGVELMDTHAWMFGITSTQKFYEKPTPFVELNHDVLDALDADYNSRATTIFELNRLIWEEFEARGSEAENISEERD